MPKTSMLGQYAKQDERLVKSIKKRMIDKDIKECGLVKVMGIHRNTHYNHMKEPEKIDIRTLRRYIRILNIPKEDIIAALYLD